MKPRTAEEYFLNQIAENGGGGSSLPSYSSSDIGKVLTVGEGSETVQTVVVPEQTVTIADGEGNDLTGYDFSSVSIGDVLQVTINGVTKNVEYEQGLGNLTKLMFDDEAGIVILCSIESLPQFVRLNAEDGTYTVSVSASVPSAEPKWEAASGGGIVDIAIGTRTAANGADNAIYVNGQELTTLEECATYLESVKDKVLRVYFPDYPEGVTSISAVTGLLVYRAGNMAYGEFMQKLPQTGEINVQTFGYMPASD
jgi:hypothetical protein